MFGRKPCPRLIRRRRVGEIDDDRVDDEPRVGASPMPLAAPVTMAVPDATA